MNNPPAFPTNIHNSGDGKYASQGMTLRDYFAAQAMQAFLSNDNLLKGACTWHKDGSETSIAVLAYDQADAMMKVR